MQATFCVNCSNSIQTAELSWKSKSGTTHCSEEGSPSVEHAWKDTGVELANSHDHVFSNSYLRDDGQRNWDEVHQHCRLDNTSS